MESLSETLHDFCKTHGFEKTYWLAYSGGLDSHVLLHLFAKLRSVFPLKIHAVYVNHGISPHADAWAKQCEAVCRALEVDFSVYKLTQQNEKNGASPEDWLRQRRYEIFAELLQPNDFLLTAHHQNDQAETVLLQLLRGAGPKGLAAMPRIKPFARGFHARPLLDFTRDDLKKYAEENYLHWIDDESNFNVNYARNFLRHEILPVLTHRWPTVTSMLARSADNCAEAQALLESLAREDLQQVQGSLSRTLSVKKLLVLPEIRQRQVLRTWLADLNLPLPSAVKLQQILTTMLQARSDKMPHMSWRGIELRRYRDNLFVMPILSAHDSTQILSWDLQSPLSISGVGALRAELTTGQGLRSDLQNVTVRFRQGGEVIRLPGRACHHELKNVLQELGVPPWLRDRIPLIYVNGTLAAVCGYLVADEFIATKDQKGWVFELQRT